MYFADLYFYTKTTDVEFDMQITALPGPRARLGHLNHYERSSICIKQLHKTKYFRLIFKKPWFYIVKSRFSVSNGAPQIMKTKNKRIVFSGEYIFQIC